MSRFSHLMPRAVLRRTQTSIRRRRWPEDFASDDYDWRLYRSEYVSELRSIARSHTQRLRAGQYRYDNGSLVQQGDGLPLHPNHRLLYETILQLSPSSVFEAGCGGGDHLHNLNVLNATMVLSGVDRSEEQLGLLHERNPELAATTNIFDLTLPYSQALPTADVSYTQAVLMHIHTGNGHLVALANLFRVSQRQIVLMENWKRHEFLRDAQYLHKNGMTGWPDLLCYFRRSPEFDNRPHLLVLSKKPLPYEPLDDYSVLSR